MPVHYLNFIVHPAFIRSSEPFGSWVKLRTSCPCAGSSVKTWQTTWRRKIWRWAAECWALDQSYLTQVTFVIVVRSQQYLLGEKAFNTALFFLFFFWEHCCHLSQNACDFRRNLTQLPQPAKYFVNRLDWMAQQDHLSHPAGFRCGLDSLGKWWAIKETAGAPISLGNVSMWDDHITLKALGGEFST